MAIVFTTALALILALTGDFGDLSRTTVLLLLATFAVVNVSVLVLRQDQVRHRHFRAPFVIPLLGAATCLVLLPQQEAGIWLRAAILIAVGLVLYLGNIAFKRRDESPAP